MPEKGTKTGRELERRVAQAYRNIGARRVEQDVELAGHQVDVYIELETPDRGLYRTAVEVKDYASPVGIKIVANFSDIVDRLRRERLVDDGIIVSAAGFTRPARNAAKQHGIRLLELADLDTMVVERRGADTTGKTAKVMVLIERNIQEFTSSEQETLVLALSRLVNVSPNQVRVLWVSQGSVLVTLEMSEDAARKLISLFLREDPILETLHIARVDLVQVPSRSVFDQEFRKAKSGSTPMDEASIEDVSGAIRLRLENIRPGVEDDRTFEQYALKILSSFLPGQLSYAEHESRTVYGTEHRHIISFNAMSHKFWQMVGQRHAAAQVVFECKNVKSLELRHVDQLAGYLGSFPGSFGVIVSRVPPSENLQRAAITIFNSHKKLILFLSDEDLVEMGQLYAQGADATAVIEHKYVQLTRQAQ